MRKLYDSIDFAKIGHYQSILESQQIETFLKNQAVSSIMGDVPFAEVFPELWVVNDEDYDRAIELIREHREVMPSRTEDWVCPNCGEQVPKEFDSCWNCESGEPSAASQP